MSTPELRQRFNHPLEVRDSPRAGLDLPVDLHMAGVNQPLPGRTRDVGVNGLCATTPLPFVAKNLRHIVLHLSSESLKVQAEGIWQQTLDHDDVVMTGVSFVDPPDEVVRKLWDLVLDRAKDFARFIHADSELRGIDVEGAMGLAQVTRLRQLTPGALLFEQGPARPGECSIFLVDEGAIAVEMISRAGTRQPVAQLGRGALVGGLPLVAGCDHPETARANGGSRLLEIDESAFGYLDRCKPWLAQVLRQAVTIAYARRLHEMIARVREGR